MPTPNFEKIKKEFNDRLDSFFTVRKTDDGQWIEEVDRDLLWSLFNTSLIQVSTQSYRQGVIDSIIRVASSDTIQEALSELDNLKK